MHYINMKHETLFIIVTHFCNSVIVIDRIYYTIIDNIL